jgi:hypothetical protein
LDRRVQQVLAWVIFFGVLAGYTFGIFWVWFPSTYDDLDIKYHSTEVYSLGFFDQGERIKVRVVVDEGSVKVLEGRIADVHLLDSENRAQMELQQGWEPLQTIHIDTRETDEGRISYEAHADDTYYIVYQNFDFFDLTLKVADNDALGTQLFLKVLWFSLLVVELIAFGRFYGQLMDVDVRRVLGLVRRPRGPGAMAAKERGEATPPKDVHGHAPKVLEPELGEK